MVNKLDQVQRWRGFCVAPSASLRLVLVALALLFVTACASAPNTDLNAYTFVAHDPYQNMNRQVFAFNESFDKAVLVPVVTGYEKVTPDIVETGVSNFFSNLSDLNNFVNHSLQLKPIKASKDIARLALNSTVGLLGLIDVASSIGLHQDPEDFGQTLGHWGVSSGPYLVLPFVGPSNFRDAGAQLTYSLNDPTKAYNLVAGDIPAIALEVIELRHQLGDYRSFMSGDPYEFMREAYIQRRQYLVNDGMVDFDDDFDDF